jgi:ornithine cyclodeaminase/alanine dehydrogenase-like protein (mu-crystallin family)
VIILNADDVAALLPMQEAISVVREAMIRVSAGKAALPLRTATPVGEGGNLLGVMPGVMNDSGLYGVKVLSLFPNNPARGLSSHIGAMILFDPDTGIPSAVINADALTAIRTSAASAAATDALARKECSVLAIVGTGEQAETHIPAMLAVRPITRILVAGRNHDKAKAFVEKVGPHYPAITFHAAPDVPSAVGIADIVCTTTSSAAVVLRGDWIGPGVHVNAVGASIPKFQEIDEALVLKSRLFTDYIPSALAQAKEIIEALASGAMAKSHILGEIGQVFSGEIPGRRSDAEITLYRSLGIAAQDICCAEHVRQRAAKAGRGSVAPL